MCVRLQGPNGELTTRKDAWEFVAAKYISGGERYKKKSEVRENVEAADYTQNFIYIVIYVVHM